MAILGGYDEQLKEDSPIKLAEALLIKAEYEERLESLRSRLMVSARVQDGSFPPEDPETLIADVQTCLNHLASISKRISITQSQTLLDSRQTVAAAIVDQEMLLKKQSIYQSIIEGGIIPSDVAQGSSIRWLITVNLAGLNRRIEEMIKDYRLLETEIQQVSWNTELVD
ncbi:MAG: DIP1984 family protein [Microcystaceae cyanobacterium]